MPVHNPSLNIVSFTVSRTDELSSQRPIGLRRTVRRCKGSRPICTDAFHERLDGLRLLHACYEIVAEDVEHGSIEGDVVLTE